MGELAFPLVAVPVWRSKLVPDRHLSPLATVAMATVMSSYIRHRARRCSSRTVTGPVEARELAGCKEQHRVKQTPCQPSASKQPPTEEVRLVFLIFLTSWV